LLTSVIDAINVNVRHQSVESGGQGRHVGYNCSTMFNTDNGNMTY